jgi:hypothetical protein
MDPSDLAALSEPAAGMRSRTMARLNAGSGEIFDSQGGADADRMLADPLSHYPSTLLARLSPPGPGSVAAGNQSGVRRHLQNIVALH